MRILPIILILAVVVFVVGLVAPRKSYRLERWMTNRLKDAEDAADRRAGWVGDWTAKLLCWGQEILESAVSAGRGLRRRLPGNS